MNKELLATLRQRNVLIAVGAGVVILLIWLVAVFIPEGHKLASINSNVQQARSEQASLQTRLARLKAYSQESGQFQALAQRLAAAVPATTDVYDYITAISNAATATGMAVSGISPDPAAADGNVAVIPVTVAATGTYQQSLAFMKALYALPRLTVISQINISGGGTGTNRSTILTEQFNLDIFAQSSAASPQG